MKTMKLKRHMLSGAAFVALLLALGIGRVSNEQTLLAQARGGVQAPNLAVDPLWPKPLPNGWILGSVTGVAIDAEDNVWITHRGGPTLTAGTENGLGTTPPTAELCCAPTPSVLKFDPAGNLVAYWDGAANGVAWPRAVSGLTLDMKGNVWVGGVSNGVIEGRPETNPATAAPAAAQPAGGGRGGERGAAEGRGGAGRGA